MWDLILHDSVAWGSIIGIAIMLAMSAYYVCLSIHNTKDDL